MILGSYVQQFDHGRGPTPKRTYYGCLFVNCSGLSTLIASPLCPIRSALIAYRYVVRSNPKSHNVNASPRRHGAQISESQLIPSLHGFPAVALVNLTRIIIDWETPIPVSCLGYGFLSGGCLYFIENSRPCPAGLLITKTNFVFIHAAVSPSFSCAPDFRWTWR